MRAAGHVDNLAGSDVVTRRRKPSHPTPVYASSPSSSRSSASSLDTSLRGWPAQLAQWALVFAVLGLLIGGVKWWDRHRGQDAAAPPQPASASVMAAESNGSTDR